ncbi:hypothetical protein AcW1_007700 [Taiwanofungus camphoratus]|nr:hypothetical protein AcW1_007700 [Antrodia cinnamomea]
MKKGYWSERGRLAADAAWVAAAHSDAPATQDCALLAPHWYGYELAQDSMGDPVSRECWQTAGSIRWHASPLSEPLSTWHLAKIFVVQVAIASMYCLLTHQTPRPSSTHRAKSAMI